MSDWKDDWDAIHLPQDPEPAAVHADDLYRVPPEDNMIWIKGDDNTIFVRT